MIPKRMALPAALACRTRELSRRSPMPARSKAGAAAPASLIGGYGRTGLANSRTMGALSNSGSIVGGGGGDGFSGGGFAGAGVFNTGTIMTLSNRGSISGGGGGGEYTCMPPRGLAAWESSTLGP